MALATND
jgi:hypothetical protein